MRFDISVNLTLLALRMEKSLFLEVHKTPEYSYQDLIEVYCHFIALGSSVSGILMRALKI